MADDATSVGGIKGTLDLDLGPWDRAIAQVKGDVAEIKGLDADVKLTASITEAERQIAIVDAAADRLDAKSVTVRVKADGTDAVAAAEAKVAAAVAASDTAFERARISELRLEEVREQGTATASRVASAELALSVASQKSEAAASAEASARGALAAVQAQQAAAAADAATAEEALSAAQSSSFVAASADKSGKLAVIDAAIALVAAEDAAANAILRVEGAQIALAATSTDSAAAEGELAAAFVVSADAARAAAVAADELTAAQAAEAASSTAVGAATEGAGSQTALMGAAVAAAAVAIPLLTTAAAAAGGALVGMAGSGVLAVDGIKTAMTDGTAEGEAYSAGIQSLKGDMDSLASTAASGLLGSFQTAVDDVSAAMPALNAEVSTFTGYLGGTGDALIGSVVDGMQILNPLFIQGASYIQSVAQGLQNWTTDGGLQSFATYAESELPRVEVLLNQLGQAAESLGPELAGLANDFTDIVSAVNGVAEAGQQVEKLAKAGDDLTSFTKSVPILEDVVKAVGGVLNPIQGLNDALAPLQPLIDKWTGATKDQTAASAAAAAATKAQQSAVQSLAARYGESVPEYKAAEKAATDQTSSTKAATLAMQAEGDAAGLLTNALTILNQGALDVDQAQTGAAAAANAAVDAFNQNGLAINGNSKAAVANQQAIQQAATAIGQLGTATAQQTGSTADGVTAMKKQKQAFEDQLNAAHKLTPAVRVYIDQLIDLNNLKVTEVNFKADASAAEAAIAAYKTVIANVPKTHQTNMVAERDAAEASLKAMIQDLKTVPAEHRTELLADIKAAEDNIADYDRQLSKVPGHISTTAYVDTSAAMSSIQALNAAVANISHSAIVSAPQVGPSSASALANSKHSHGGEIAQHFASGGTSGSVLGSVGSATSDSLITRLSIGEEVTSTYAASYPGVRPVLKALNADPAGTMRGLAQQSQSPAPVVRISFAGDATWLKDFVNVEIDKDHQRSKVRLSAGLQAGSF